eukprot:5587315-Amphidinium_carterae.1
MLKQCQVSSHVSDDVVESLANGVFADGIGEMSRFALAPTPDSNFCARRIDLTKFQPRRVDLLPLPLPALGTIDRSWARTHARQAKVK